MIGSRDSNRQHEWDPAVEWRDQGQRIEEEESRKLRELLQEYVLMFQVPGLLSV